MHMYMYNIIDVSTLHRNATRGNMRRKFMLAKNAWICYNNKYSSLAQLQQLSETWCFAVNTGVTVRGYIGIWVEGGH